jgi:hypothetical protein
MSTSSPAVAVSPAAPAAAKPVVAKKPAAKPAAKPVNQERWPSRLQRSLRRSSPS